MNGLHDGQAVRRIRTTETSLSWQVGRPALALGRWRTGFGQRLQMSLPNWHDAWIPRAKLQEYLLDPDHPTGGAKARFFAQLGYTRENLEALEQAFLALARRETVEQELATRHGTKYVLGG